MNKLSILSNIGKKNRENSKRKHSVLVMISKLGTFDH